MRKLQYIAKTYLDVPVEEFEHLSLHRGQVLEAEMREAAPEVADSNHLRAVRGAEQVSGCRSTGWRGLDAGRRGNAARQCRAAILTSS